MSDDHAKKVRLVIDGGVEVTPPVKTGAGPAGAASDGFTEVGHGGFGGLPPNDHAPSGPPEDPADPPPDLPKGCPVIALGVSAGRSYYLDGRRELHALAPKDHSRLGLEHLFGQKAYLLDEYWPKVNADGKRVGWRPEQAARRLIMAASAKGIWNPFERQRGKGGWRADDGTLVLHCGDAVLTGERWNEPGLIGRYVYVGTEPIAKPARVPAKGGAEGPGNRLLEILSSWNWKRGDIAPLLLLGWIVAAPFGGALDWRPLVWITGGAGTGKSTLHHVIGAVLQSLIQVSDASAAGVWQKLGHSTLPVTFDELEAEEDGRRAQAVIKFARQAASGGLVLRGGADHGASEFVARSCMLFSSILVPPLTPQDRSRMALLELGELQSTTPPPTDKAELGKIGAGLLRRVIDQWDRYADTLVAYRAALTAEGHGNRGADLFGTLLAMADLAIADFPADSDSVKALAVKLQPAMVGDADETAADQERCLRHLLTSIIPLDGPGLRRTVGDWLQRAAESDPEAGSESTEASRILGTHGMRLFEELGEGKLAIANSHQALARLFQGTHWAGKSGTVGVWVQTLRRLPGAAPAGMMRIGGVAMRATTIPDLLVIDPETRPAPIGGGGAEGAK